MRWTVLVALMALAAPPVSAQVGFQFGPLVSWLYDFQQARIGFYGGVHYDVSDRFRVGVLYASKGEDCCVVHTAEVPITYRRKLDEVAYVVAGVVPHYGEFPEINVLVGLGAEAHRSDTRVVGLEAAFIHGVLGAAHDTGYGLTRYKSFRVGLVFR